MKKSKVLSGVLSFVMVFSAMSVPLSDTLNGVFGKSVITADAATTITSGIWKYEEISGGIKITSCTQKTGDIVIPSTLDGKTVKEIGGLAITNNLGQDKITSVEIPCTVTQIGILAFPATSKCKLTYCKGTAAAIYAALSLNTKNALDH